MGKIKLILGASILLLSGHINAAIIDATNTNTEYSAGKFADLQGLQWLTLNETQGQSRDSIESGYGDFLNDGWRYATLNETGILLNSLWGGTWDGWGIDNAPGASWFLNTLGSLYLTTVPGGELRQSSFFYGNEGECPVNFVVVPDMSCMGVVQYMSNIDGTLTTYNTATGQDEISYLPDSGPVGNLNDHEGLNIRLRAENQTVNYAIENSVIGSLLVREVPEPVTIDIKPGSERNPVNPRSKGVIPIAVLGSTDFDAMQVDYSTVKFGPGEALSVHDGHVEDVNDDDYMDMVFHFKTQETGFACGDTEATLTGATFGGIPFTGTDAVKTVGCN